MLNGLLRGSRRRVNSKARVAQGASCLWRELSQARVVSGASCLRRELTRARVVPRASCLRARVVPRELSMARDVTEPCTMSCASVTVSPIRSMSSAKRRFDTRLPFISAPPWYIRQGLLPAHVPGTSWTDLVIIRSLGVHQLFVETSLRCQYQLALRSQLDCIGFVSLPSAFWVYCSAATLFSLPSLKINNM